MRQLTIHRGEQFYYRMEGGCICHLAEEEIAMSAILLQNGRTPTAVGAIFSPSLWAILLQNGRGLDRFLRYNVYPIGNSTIEWKVLIEPCVYKGLDTNAILLQNGRSNILKFDRVRKMSGNSTIEWKAFTTHITNTHISVGAILLQNGRANLGYVSLIGVNTIVQFYYRMEGMKSLFSLTHSHTPQFYYRMEGDFVLDLLKLCITRQFYYRMEGHTHRQLHAKHRL